MSTLIDLVNQVSRFTEELSIHIEPHEVHIELWDCDPSDDDNPGQKLTAEFTDSVGQGETPGAVLEHMLNGIIAGRRAARDIIASRRQAQGGEHGK